MKSGLKKEVTGMKKGSGCLDACERANQNNDESEGITEEKEGK